jgi:thioredoxin-related protein
MKSFSLINQRFLLCLTALFFFVSSSHIPVKESAQNEPEILYPEIQVTDINAEDVNMESLRNLTGFTLIVYYKTSCPFCEKEFNQINTLKPEVTNQLSVIAASVESLGTIFSYRKKVNMEEKENVHFIRNRDLFLGKYFDVKRVPSNFLFDENGTLVLETHSLDEVLEYITSSNAE